MNRTMSRFSLTAACLVLTTGARAANYGSNAGPMSVHPMALPASPSVTAPTFSVQSDIPGVSAIQAAPGLTGDILPADITGVVPAAHQGEQPSAMQNLQHAASAMSIGDSAASSMGQQFGASQQAFDGRFGAYDNDSGFGQSLSDPNGWQAEKIRQARELVKSTPLGGALLNALGANEPLHQVDNRWNPADYTVRTIGDDKELQRHANGTAIVYHPNALRNLSPYYLAAKMVGAMLNFVQDQIPQSAEKTYARISAEVRTFVALTGSNQHNWRGDLDRVLRYKWEAGQQVPVFEQHQAWWFWQQGLSAQTVRHGPLFKEKIMQGSGDPQIDTDQRGRMTLNQRANANQITQEKLTEARGAFDGFTANER